MERSKLKLTVIFLLAVLNLVLLGCVLVQYHQARSYEKMTQTQILAYLENNGITARRETIPWQTALTTQPEDLADQLLEGEELPAQGLPASCEIQPARETATLLMDFVRGLDELDRTCTELRSIAEGYHYSGEGDRAVLTPMWMLETDNGCFQLDCADGDLTQVN